MGIDANKDGREDDLVASNIFIGEPLDPIYDYNIIGMWQVEDYNKGIIPDGFCMVLTRLKMLTMTTHTQLRMTGRFLVTKILYIVSVFKTILLIKILS